MRNCLLLCLGLLVGTALAAPPPLLQVSPNFDVAAGGTSVTIEASAAFEGSSESYQVSFGGAEAQITGIDGTTLTVLAPAGTAPSHVDVTVTDLSDDGSADVPDGFYYITGAPSITRLLDPQNPLLTPPVGSTGGGHTVIVEGTGLSFTSNVRFGNVDASPASINVLSDTQVEVTTPPNSTGLKSVTVQVTPGELVASANNVYRYISGPSVDQVFPAVGASMGGTVTNIFGQGLTNVTSVTFGGVPATITFAGADRVEVVVGPHPAGTVDVVVSNIAASTTLPNAFTFFDPPEIADISPSTGPSSGGNEVTITGIRLGRLLEVRFDGIKATLRSSSDTKLVVVAPAHEPGEVDVEVTTVGGTDTTSYTYLVKPTITGVNPTQGSTGGGYPVTITGTNLDDTQEVFFGAGLATIVNTSDTQVIVLAPPRANPGVVPVGVTTGGGTATLSNAFTYVRGIGIDTVTPPRGFTVGGETITITGTGFNNIQSVRVGGTPSLVYTIEGNTKITIISPPGDAGLTDVEIRTVAESFVQPGAYEYIDPDTPFGALRGTIRDFNTNAALARATVVARLDGAIVGVGAADANGEYLISSLDPGEYNLEVFAVGYQRDIANATVLEGEEEIINFPLMPLGQGIGTIAGRVVEIFNETPIVGARVQAVHTSGIITTYTCADGTYDIPNIPLDGGLAVNVMVTAPGYDPTQREVMIGNQIANFILNRDILPGKLSGNVFDARNNQPIEGAQVILMPTLGMAGFGRETSASGGFSFRNVDYATYDLRVSAPGFQTHFANITLNTAAGQQIVVKLEQPGGGGFGCAGKPGDAFAAGDIAALVTLGLLALAIPRRRPEHE